MNLLRNFSRDEPKASWVEYGLLTLLIICVIIIMISLMGGSLKVILTYISGKF